MKKYGLILTQNYKPISFLRFETKEEAEAAYQANKMQGFGVVKVNIEKAYEPIVMRIPEPY